jgi:hypothetical protein
LEGQLVVGDRRFELVVRALTFEHAAIEVVGTTERRFDCQAFGAAYEAVIERLGGKR